MSFSARRRYQRSIQYWHKLLIPKAAGQSKLWESRVKNFKQNSAGNMEFVNLLLERGASLGGIYLFDFPITRAASNGHIEIVRRLLEAGSNANPADGNGSAIKYAEENNHDEIVKLLKEYESRNKREYMT